MTVSAGTTIDLEAGLGAAFLAAEPPEPEESGVDAAEEASLDADCWSADFWHPVRPRKRARVETNAMDHLRFI
jgi:hypothetical protein